MDATRPEGARRAASGGGSQQPPGQPPNEPPAFGHEAPPPPDAPAPSSGDSGTKWTKAFAKLPVPLLPIVALVVAVGVVAYALSTQQISLNFAGAAPKEPQVGPKDGQVAQRGPGERASRGAGRADGLVIRFQAVSRTSTGYRATVTIANRGQRPVPRWALAFQIPGTSVRAVKGATLAKPGARPLIRSRAGAPALAPGHSVRFVFAAKGPVHGPSSCILNRLPCARV
ncbi:hypothetical protein GEV43_04490 [Actinomadura sp. J1-007]|nr:cellulose binding domain-containing protein [Actinomadura sp. J1-007]MWK33371.1 hypothetical protein [Actinomadura sp. J1-007]